MHPLTMVSSMQHPTCTPTRTEIPRSSLELGARRIPLRRLELLFNGADPLFLPCNHMWHRNHRYSDQVTCTRLFAAAGRDEERSNRGCGVKRDWWFIRVAATACSYVPIMIIVS